jgi:hypothetical protein
MQRHCGRVPDFGDKNGMTPFVFGCKVIRLRDEIERTNWKGAGKRVADGSRPRTQRECRHPRRR